MILPTLALALGWIGFIARLIRTSMLEVMGEPYIRTSRAYGLSRRLVTYKYALKNACIPTITILGMGIGRLLGGAVLVEIVFARPGLGRLIYNAISERNYPVVQGAVLVVVVLFVAREPRSSTCPTRPSIRASATIRRAGERPDDGARRRARASCAGSAPRSPEPRASASWRSCWSRRSSRPGSRPPIPTGST